MGCASRSDAKSLLPIVGRRFTTASTSKVKSFAERIPAQQDFHCTTCGLTKANYPNYRHKCPGEKPVDYQVKRASLCAECSQNENGVCQTLKQIYPDLPCLIEIGVKLPGVNCPLFKWRRVIWKCDKCKSSKYNPSGLRECPVCHAVPTIPIPPGPFRPRNIRRELVIARYNEKIEWVASEAGSFDLVTVYNKGTMIREQLGSKVVINPLKNFGREAQTYLHHIVTNYDTLAETTFFCQGNPHIHSPDFSGLIKLDYDSPKSLTSMYKPNVPSDGIKALDQVEMIGGFETRYGLFMHFGCRLPEVNKRWFDAAWATVFACPFPDEYYFGYGASWAVPRASIRSRSRAFYQSLLDAVSNQGKSYRQFSQPVDAWALEVMWRAIFEGPEKYPGVIL